MADLFEFTNADGATIEVPYAFDAIKRKDFKKIQKKHKNDPEGMDDALMEAAGFTKEQLDYIDELSVRDYQKFSVAWLEAEDAPLGES